jgi:hypothetical protein
MNLRALLDALAEFVETSLQEMRLPVKQEGWDDQPRTRAIEIYKQRMPSASDAKEKVPYVLLQMLNGSDDEKASGEQEHKASIRVIVTIFDWDPQQGALSLLNIVEKLRFDLLKAGIIGDRFTLLKPFEFLIYPDDTIPYHVAELSTVWGIPAVEREIQGLHWR